MIQYLLKLEGIFSMPFALLSRVSGWFRGVTVIYPTDVGRWNGTLWELNFFLGLLFLADLEADLEADLWLLTEFFSGDGKKSPSIYSLPIVLNGVLFLLEEPWLSGRASFISPGIMKLLSRVGFSVVIFFTSRRRGWTIGLLSTRGECALPCILSAKLLTFAAVCSRSFLTCSENSI